MTAARARTIEDRMTLEELVMFLSAPDPRDPQTITDPVAVFGTRPLEASAPMELAVSRI